MSKAPDYVEAFTHKCRLKLLNIKSFSVNKKECKEQSINGGT
jgi:hypothetical protein